MMGEIMFLPHISWPLLAGLACIVLCLSAFAAWRNLSGWMWRACAGVGVIAALSNPVLLTEETTPLTDIVVLMIDETASQKLGERSAQTRRAQAQVEARVGLIPNTELLIVTLKDDAENRGSLMMSRIAEALAEEPRARLAGVIMISDGRLHDAQITPDLPAPLHLLLTGQPRDWDRRLILRKASAFAILDEEFVFTLEIEDQGAVPSNLGGSSELLVSIDGGDPIELTMPVGREVEVPLTLDHGGINTLHFTIPALNSELTDQNNQAVVQVNGVRDRLRVLLVSGEPHNGERTWRNILNSDAAVDLVHFTILRPIDKQDGTPITELSLISFPTRELFMEKVDDFDLIIFDRYKLRGILPAAYLENIARYAEQGGAILVSAGPDFAGVNSLYHSPLSRVIPAKPTGRLFEEGYLPQITGLGDRHPVTRGLAETGFSNDQTEESAPWGRWFRQIDLEPTSGDVVMSGIEDRPLLVLDHVGAGRVAVLGSDHAWLWARGVEGGGPQSELLRRLAHWMMQEPDLEEELLSAQTQGANLVITRRTLSEASQRVIVVGPDGESQTVELTPSSAGVFTATLPTPAQGVYRLRDAAGNQQLGEPSSADSIEEAVVVVGPTAPREFLNVIADTETSRPAVEARDGGILKLSDGVPDIRTAREGRPAAGRNWIAITPRGAVSTLSSRTVPLLPSWSWAIFLAALAITAWLREGRKQ